MVESRILIMKNSMFHYPTISDMVEIDLNILNLSESRIADSMKNYTYQN